MENIDFFLIGAQKCATSWMYLCLKEHPEISVPKEKEDGYIGGDLFNNNGEEWFFNRFTNSENQKVRGDISVEYLYNADTAPLLKKYAKDPKFIVSLRHPVDRLISSYYWLVRVGKLPNIPIENAIENILNQPSGFPNKIEGPLEEIVRRSCYPHQLKKYLEHYDKEKFFVIQYEDIKGNEQEVINKVYNFLAVKHFTPPSLKKQQLKNTYNNTSIAIENKLNRKSLFGKALAKAAIVANMSFVKSTSQDKVLSSEKREILNHLFSPVIEETEKIIESFPSKNRLILEASSSNKIW